MNNTERTLTTALALRYAATIRRADDHSGSDAEAFAISDAGILGNFAWFVRMARASAIADDRSDYLHFVALRYAFLLVWGRGN